MQINFINVPVTKHGAQTVRTQTVVPKRPNAQMSRFHVSVCLYACLCLCLSLCVPTSPSWHTSVLSIRNIFRMRPA